MRVVSAEEMRQLDRETIEAGTPGEVLMDRAGRGVARYILELAALANWTRPRAAVAAGPGNNGGDAFVTARELHAAGWEVQLWLALERDRLQGDAALHFQRMLAVGVPVVDAPAAEAWTSFAPRWFAPQVVVDGLLGTGARGAPRGVIAAAVAALQRAGCGARVVAIDLPSGMDADTGRAEGDAVRADLTVTFGLPKLGFVQPEATPLLGTLRVAPIGLDEGALADLPTRERIDLVTAEDFASLSPRAAEAHKGSCGHVLVVGGMRGMSGAVRLAAEGALRAGAGLVTVVTPVGAAATVQTARAEFLVRAAPENREGALDVAGMACWSGDVNSFDALVLGPGLGRTAGSTELVATLLRELRIPAVLDADALVAVAGRSELLSACRAPLVVTPHPGEMARLIASTVAEVQAARLACARDHAMKTGAMVVLKGAGTVVASPDGRLSVNRSGNPGLATGGAGDVLAGYLGGLLGQGMDPLEAARFAVLVHGLAGDRAAAIHGQHALLADDVLHALGPAAAGLWGR